MVLSSIPSAAAVVVVVVVVPLSTAPAQATMDDKSIASPTALIATKDDVAENLVLLLLVGFMAFPLVSINDKEIMSASAKIFFGFTLFC